MSEVKTIGQVIKSPGNLKNGDIYNGKIINLAVDKVYRNPIDTFLLLLKSTRFQAILGYAIAGIIINLIPELAPARAFINQLWVLVVAFIVGRSVEDALLVWKNNQDPDVIKEAEQLEAIAKHFWEIFNKNLLNNADQTPAEQPDTPTTEPNVETPA